MSRDILCTYNSGLPLPFCGFYATVKAWIQEAVVDNKICANTVNVEIYMQDKWKWYFGSNTYFEFQHVKFMNKVENVHNNPYM